MLSWIKSLFAKKAAEPRMIEHRGMKFYMNAAMIDMFKRNNIDYETEFRMAVDEVLDNEETDEDNPYK